MLVVCAEHGIIEPQQVSEMTARLPHAEIIELAGAQHDLHLDRPREWQETLTAFLLSVDS